MTNEPKAFSATVFYTDKDGAPQEIRALVLAPDFAEAMQGAIKAVSSLPNCEEVLGGVLDEASEAELASALAYLNGPNAQAAPARAHRPQGATVH